MALTVTNGTDVLLRSGSVSFVTSDGQQADSNVFLGPVDVRPGATATLVFEFASNDLPTGTLYYDAFIDEPNYTPVSLVVSIGL